MTCKEKLKQEHPEFVDSDKYAPYECRGCPADYGYLDDPDDKDCKPSNCAACWDREIPEKVDNVFEWLHPDGITKILGLVACEGVPEQFEYWNQNCEEPVYVTVLKHHRHHYTDDIVYRIREEGRSGWVDERYCTKRDIARMLETKMEDNDDQN